VELLAVVGVALAVALVTLLLCDLAGSIARAKGTSYWRFFLLGLLLWFPALLAALALPDRSGGEPVRDTGRAETAVAGLLAAVGAAAAAVGVWAAITAAP
jgi:hypothetical protein